MVRRKPTQDSLTDDESSRLQDAQHSDMEGTDKEDPPPGPPDPKKRARSFMIRTMSTFAMIGSFFFIVYLGHVPMMFLVFFLQFHMVKELFMLARVSQKDRRLPGFRAQQWYFFLVATFYLYLRFIKHNLLVELTSNRYTSVFTWVLRRHSILSYSLYMAGFMSFVLSLKKGMYLYQFGQYAWTHMILMIIFVPSSFFVSNIFEGLIWFLLPSCLIIVNDIMAYLAGFFFGRTPLIKLSPKKTWEGFLGGFIGTVISAFYLAKIFIAFKWMTCPRLDLSLGPLNCHPDPLYLPHTFRAEDVLRELPPGLKDPLAPLAQQLLPAWLGPVDSWSYVVEPMVLHAMVLACFASLVAPFGGFFASGFKRAFKMKDFGDTIPGHGGVTDRFDCQMIMAMFAYIYYWSFIAQPQLSVGHVLDMALKLNDQQQLELFAKLGFTLLGQGAVAGSVMPALEQAVAAAEAAAVRNQPT